MKLVAKTILSVFLFFSICASANASIITYEFDIAVTDLFGTNTFGLTAGDTVSVDIALDNNFDPGTDPNFTTHTPVDYTEFSLAVTINGTSTTTFTHSDDVGYDNWPYVTANLPGWYIHRFELLTDEVYVYVDETNNMKMTSVFFDDDIDAWLPALQFIDGVWVENDDAPEPWSLDGEITGSLAPIPEPTTIVLLSLGLLGMAGLARRQEQ